MIRVLAYLCIVVMVCPGCAQVHREVAAHRKEYKAGFLTDPRSPLQEADLELLDFFPSSAKAVLQARVILTPSEEPFEMPTYSGVTRTYRQYAIGRFAWKSDSVDLSIYQNFTLMSNPAYSDYLFLPFKDGTNGRSTYGGGRYLNLSKTDTMDGYVTIDFNKAYNPWCAYSDGFNCPIPPRSNHLSFEIHAGEKSYKGEVKHQ